MPDTSTLDPVTEAQLRNGQQRFLAGSKVQRFMLTAGANAVLFLVVAVGLAVLVDWNRPLSPLSLGVIAIVYLAGRRASFPVGSAHTWPAQLVVIPMLFLLPLPLVPLVNVGLATASALPQQVHKRMPLPQAMAQVTARISDGWSMIGSVVILLIFASGDFSWSHWPVYLLAIAVQFACDLVMGYLIIWLAEGIRPATPGQIGWLYLIDAALSSGGLQLAAVASGTHALVLLELPIMGMMVIFARERQHRTDTALALSSAYRGTAVLLGDVIEGDDEYTGFHSREVVEASLAVADRLGVSPMTRQRVEFGALLHDVGKIRVPNEIINKTTKLNDEERELMRQHTIFGEEMLLQVGGALAGVGHVVRQSHEHWDGSGYPDGLRGEQISLEARIIGACDAYNAMTTDRSYRPAMSRAAAAAELRRGSGSQFDPDVVAAILAEFCDDDGLHELH